MAIENAGLVLDMSEVEFGDASTLGTWWGPGDEGFRNEVWVPCLFGPSRRPRAGALGLSQ
jgi:hypothetical protein